jgi:ketosteroid isomerase-like protein
MILLWLGLGVFAMLAVAPAPSPSALEKDRQAVAALDTEYQAAVGRIDVAAMDRILADDFVLVTGRGKTFTKADLLDEARSGRMVYERQEDTHQTVRVWGDTAVITALIWEKGTNAGKPFAYKVGSATRTCARRQGWRYVFGQSSLPLPEGP